MFVIAISSTIIYYSTRNELALLAHYFRLSHLLETSAYV